MVSLVSGIRLCQLWNKYTCRDTYFQENFLLSKSSSAVSLYCPARKPRMCKNRGGVGGDREFKPPASRTLQSRFPPCICWLPSLCIFSIAQYCAMLLIFPFSPASRHLGNPACGPFFSRLLYTSRPLFSWSSAPLSPPPPTHKISFRAEAWV